MAKTQNIPEKYRVWIEARRRYHLSDTQIQMARELGLNPRKFDKLANEKQEPWKKPLPEFIRLPMIPTHHIREISSARRYRSRLHSNLGQ